MKQRKILLVDDEEGIRQSLSGVLEDEGYVVTAVESGEACLAALPETPCELVLLDIWLPGMDGMAVLERIQEVPFDERPVVVVISGHGSIETAVKATKLGAFDFLEKPLSIGKVAVVTKNALAHRSLEIQNIRLKADTGARYSIIGDSVPMKALRQQLTLMAEPMGGCWCMGKAARARNWWRMRCTR
jgi:two-component system, NtrC family, nitrogen regulation response regulator NtrX